MFAKIQENWKSGLTVSLVSLPLNIALSIASGAGPIPGVITGVWAGIVASFFGSSNYNIIGTAGALTTILSAFAATQIGNGNSAFLLPLLAMVTGLIIMLIYFLGLEKYLIYIPSSVMYGFAAGVAITIAFNQLRDAFGLYNLHKHNEFLPNTIETFSHLHQTKISTFMFFLGFLALLLLFKKYVKAIPGVIPASILGIIFGYLPNINSNFDLGLTTLRDKQGEFVVNLIAVPNFGLYFDLLKDTSFLIWILNTALVVALVAILETFITAKLADKITSTKFSPRKELFGLGLANLASGLAGGLPATGVFIRTGLNIRSQATDKMSARIAAVSTAILSVIFLPFFQYIPMCVIAAILFNTAIGLIEIHQLQRFWQKDKSSLFVCVLVAIITVIADASIGILIGVALSLLLFVDKLSKGEFEATFNINKKVIECDHGNCFIFPNTDIDVIVYSIEGIMAYIDAPKHKENFEKMEKMEKLESVVIRLRDLFYLDLDGLDLLEEAIADLHRQHKNVMITAPSPQVEKVLCKSETFKNLYQQNKVFDKTADALKSIGFEKEDLRGAKTPKVQTVFS